MRVLQLVEALVFVASIVQTTVAFDNGDNSVGANSHTNPANSGGATKIRPGTEPARCRQPSNDERERMKKGPKDFHTAKDRSILHRRSKTKISKRYGYEYSPPGSPNKLTFGTAEEQAQAYAHVQRITDSIANPSRKSAHDRQVDDHIRFNDAVVDEVDQYSRSTEPYPCACHDCEDTGNGRLYSHQAWQKFKGASLDDMLAKTKDSYSEYENTVNSYVQGKKGQQSKGRTSHWKA